MPRQKDTDKGSGIEIEPKKIHEFKREPLRFKLMKSKVVTMDDTLKRIYRIRN